MSLTEIAFWITYVIGVCAAIYSPVVGLAVYVLVYHLNPETQWWGATVQALNLRTSFIVAAAIGVGVLLRHPPLARGAKQFPGVYILALLFGVVTLGSLAWGVDVTERSEYLAEKYVKLLILLFMMLRCIRTPQHYHLILLSWLLGVFYLGYQAQGGAGGRIHGRLTYGVGGSDFADSSGLAVHLVATLPLVGALFFVARTWLGRGFALLAGALTVNTLIMTRTRNALAGLVAIVLVTLAHLPRGYRLKGVLAVIVGTALAAQLADPAWWQRMQTALNIQNDQSVTGRLALWNAAVRMAMDHPLGIGLGNFHEYVMVYIPGLNMSRSAHSTPAACLAELGWAGLLIFVTIVGRVFWDLGRLRRTASELPPFEEIFVLRWRTRFHLGWHALAMQAALAGYLACALFTTRLFSEDLWLLIGLSLTLQNVARYMAEQAREGEPPGEPRLGGSLALPLADDVGLPSTRPALAQVNHAPGE